MTLDEIRNTVVFRSVQIKTLGNWPDFVSEDSLINRIPQANDAPGFDAGIACCLDLIPKNKQRLSAVLHGAYTRDAIKQVRKEIRALEKVAKIAEKRMYDEDCSPKWFETVESETCWWLTASSLCEETDGDGDRLIIQIEEFKRLIDNDYHRYMAAMRLVGSFKKSFVVVDGIPIVTKDGGMQAAYINGYKLAVMPTAYGVWFVGTYEPNLGIPSNFAWGTKKDDKGRARSGPVFGSNQFVKCANMAELAGVVQIARKKLGVK